MNNQPSEPNGLFVYGTLMRGEVLAPNIIRANPTLWLLADCVGYDLYNLGPYPCIYPSTDGALGVVPGEYVEVESLTSLLPVLDEIEEYSPYDLDGSTYHRVPVEVNIFDGKIRTAWAYVAPKQPVAPRIESNDWRQHMGRREEIMQALAAAYLGPNRETVGEELLHRTLSEIRLSELTGKSGITLKQ